MNKYIIFLLLLCSVFDLIAQKQNILLIKSEQQRIRVEKEYVEICKDSTNSLTFNDIHTKYAQNFYPCALYNEALKSNTNYWLAFKVKNTSDENGEWIIEFQDIPFLDVFIVDSSANVQNSRTGFLVPASQKQIKGGIREQISFNLLANETKTIYAQTILNADIKTVNFISISDSKTFNQQTVIDNFKQGIFHGLLWMMLFYNLFLFISTREISYLYYVGYVFSTSVFQLEIFRYIRNAFFSETPQMNLFFGISVFVAFIFYFLLMREFIDSRKQHPKLDKILNIIIPINLVVTLFIFISQLINYNLYQAISILFALFNMIALLVFIIAIFIVGNKVSIIFSIGTLVLILGTVVILVATVLGVNPEETINYFQGGIVGEIFIFSAGLSYKYKVNEEERQKAQQDLIAQLTENEKLQTKVNRELEQKVNERTSEIIKQKDDIQHIADNLSIANADIEHKNKNITASIKYAKRIQTAILPADAQITGILPQHFILFKPKDIVSGDFYFIKQIKNLTFIAAADCTGHGVPGAFMSMLGIAILNEISQKPDIKSSAQLLDDLRAHIKHALQQTGQTGEAQDGMDIAFCAIDQVTLELSFAGANNPCWVFRKTEHLSDFIELPADHQPVGVFIKEKPFTDQAFQLQSGDTIYLFSDGYKSQFGGEKNLPLKSKYFKQIVSEISHLPMEHQKQVLENKFDEWRGENGQTDDVLVLGVRI